MLVSNIINRDAGSAYGGGLMDMVKGLTGGATQTDPSQAGVDQTGAPTQTPPGPKGDGSVGLFDGVIKKALLGGAVGAVAGFLPFIPGGPILGGVIGAISGAGFAIFGNFMKMKNIQNENQTALAGMGVQPATQQQAQTLINGQLPEDGLNIPDQDAQAILQAAGVGQTPATGQVPQTGQTGQTQYPTPGVKSPDQALLDDYLSGGSPWTDDTSGSINVDDAAFIVPQQDPLKSYMAGNWQQYTSSAPASDAPPSNVQPPTGATPPSGGAVDPKGGTVTQEEVDAAAKAAKIAVEESGGNWQDAAPAERERILADLKAVRDQLQRLLIKLQQQRTEDIKQVVEDVAQKGGVVQQKPTPPPVEPPPAPDTKPPVDTPPPVDEKPTQEPPPVVDTPPGGAPPPTPPPTSAPPTDAPPTDTPPTDDKTPPTDTPPPVEPAPVKQAPTQTPPPVTQKTAA